MNNLKPRIGKTGMPDDPVGKTGDSFYIMYRMETHDSVFNFSTEMAFGRSFMDRNDLMGVVGSELSLFFKNGYR